MPGRTRAKTHSWREIMKYATRWLSFIFLLISALATGNVSAQDGKITVMNPRGIMPAIKRIPMAPRLNSLDGKTVYIVDTKYPNTKNFVNKLAEDLSAKFPKTHWISVDKPGGYMEDAPALWAEIKKKGDAAIVLMGH